MVKNKMEEIAGELEQLLFKIDMLSPGEHGQPQPGLAKRAQSIIRKLKSVALEVENRLPSPKYSEAELKMLDHLHKEQIKTLATTSNLSKKEKLLVELEKAVQQETKPSKVFREEDPHIVFTRFQKDLESLPPLLRAGCEPGAQSHMLVYIPLLHILLKEARYLADLL